MKRQVRRKTANFKVSWLIQTVVVLSLICAAIYLIYYTKNLVPPEKIEEVVYTPGLHKSVIPGISSKREDMKLQEDGDIIFEYDDVGEWESNHKLKQISLADLPFEEKTLNVETANSFNKTSIYPINDYEVTGLPWRLLITNNHNRGLYEELKRDPEGKEYTLINWDFHSDVYPVTEDYVFDPKKVTIANWVSHAYYYGKAKDPMYWFNCYAMAPDTEYPLPGDWEMQIPLANEKIYRLPGIILNVTPDTKIATDYFEELVQEAEDGSIWLSLCGDCFSKPGESPFDPNSFRAQLLKSILDTTMKHPEKFSFIHFSRSPDYDGDVRGISKYFVQELKTRAAAEGYTHHN